MVVLFGLLGCVIVFLVGFCVGCSWIFKRNFTFTKEQCKRGDKLGRMFALLNWWMQLKEDNKDIAHYIREMGYNSIAIYGIGHLGKHLVKELNESEVHIDYLIDRKVKEVSENIIIYKPEDVLPETGLICVTAIVEYDEIVNKLVEKVQCPIISLEEIIYDIN